MAALFSRGSLTQRIIGAASWSLVGLIISYSLRLGSSLILTRLLSPQMFGIMSIVGLITTGLAMFSDLGVKQNIIQSPRGSEPTFLNTAWSIQIMRSVILWVIAVLISLIIFLCQKINLISPSNVYSENELPYVLVVATFSIVINGFQSTKFYEAGRYLALGQVTRIQILAQIAGLLCVAIWAWIDRSIWAL